MPLTYSKRFFCILCFERNRFLEVYLMSEPVITSDIKEKISNFRKDSLDVAGEGTIAVLSSFISDTLLGQIAPGVSSVIMAYRQKRFEKNIMKLLEQLELRYEILNAKIAELDKPASEKLKTDIFPLLFDYAANEEQLAKIELIVNGFEAIVDKRIFKQELILAYYDVLRGLRLADIQGLMDIYNFRLVDQNGEVEFTVKVDDGQKAFSRFVLNKLHQAGLIIIDVVWDDLKEENLYRAEQLKLTKFGLEFIHFIKTHRNEMPIK